MAAHLRFPSKLFGKTFGIGIDSGGTCIKVAHAITEDDYTCIQFARFHNQDVDEFKEYITGVCGDKMKPGTELHTCGSTTNVLFDSLVTKLGLVPKNSHEMKFLVDGLEFLCKHMAWDDVVKRPSPAAVQDGKDMAKQTVSLHTDINRSDPRLKIPHILNSPALTESTDSLTYPYIMHIHGSIPAPVLVEKDGSFNFLIFHPFGGKGFFGLGGYLTGKTTFRDVHDMAVEGDSTEVDEMANIDGVTDKNKQLKSYAFGHLVNKAHGETRKEDVVAALMSTVNQSVIRDAYLTASRTKVKQVFFCGSFVSHSDTIQNQVTRQYSYLNTLSTTGDQSEHYFLHYGAYLGALGSLLWNMELVNL